MSKKLLIMTAAAGLVSFAGTFTFAWLTKPAPQSPGTEVAQPTLTGEETNLELSQPEMVTTGAVGAVDSRAPAGSALTSKMKKAMTEKHIKSLVYEVREKIHEYNSKLQGLEVCEQRLQIAQNTLKEDIEELNNLRVELASTVANLKSERDKLQKSRVEIAKTERNNLMSIAATYDKMDATGASKILTNMSQAQNGSANDAVKILHYMTERTKAKVLATIAETEPAVSAHFCQKLKQIIEKE